MNDKKRRRGRRTDKGGGEKCSEAVGRASCWETRWRTPACQTSGGAEQKRNEAPGPRFPPSSGLPAEEKSAALSEPSRVGPWSRQHPGEKTAIWESVGVKT